MDTIERTFVDKSTWGPGPWHEEPDKVQWPDPETGLACLIVRGGGGALCGYVGVDDTHPWHGKDYEDVPAEVHGGLTYAQLCQIDDQEHGICHVPAPGEPDPLWWFGFDCSHAWDRRPESEARERQMDLPSLAFDHSSYKDIAYVRAEVASLARQVAEVVA